MSLVVQRPVVVNVITGFLGVGKTTAIRELLARKPAGERWAVLINEFGEVGIDRALVGRQPEEGEVVLRELPGGCLCCAAGVPFQVALAQLLRQARPDRLLIEPTGLGHPAEILATLTGAGYQGVIELRATLTLVDPHKCRDHRYREHGIFREQLQVADIVVASKGDLATAEDMAALDAFLAELRGADAVPRHAVVHGRLDPQWLDFPSHRSGQGLARGSLSLSLPAAEPVESSADNAVIMPACGYLRLDNSNGEYFSSGWIFDPAIEFDYRAVFSVLSGLAGVERMKAVLITSDGIMAFNMADGVLSSRPLDECVDSRLEVIGRDPQQWETLEDALLDCRL